MGPLPAIAASVAANPDVQKFLKRKLRAATKALLAALR